MESERDTQLESMLDALGERERAAPDAGFEDRIAHGARPVRRATPGRRRLFIGPAVLTGAAALIAVGVLLLPQPAPQATPSAGDDFEAIAEMSLTLFDDTFGIDTAFADTGDDASSFDPAALDDWFAEGDAL